MTKKTKAIVLGISALVVVGLFMPSQEPSVTEEKPKEENIQDGTNEEVIETSVSSEEEKEKVEVSIETITSIIKSTMEDKFDYFEIEFDETTNTIDVKVTNDGMSMAVLQIMSGQADMSNWDLVKDSTDECSISLRKSAKENFGVDIDLSITVLNDENTERMFYKTTNGETDFDILAE